MSGRVEGGIWGTEVTPQKLKEAEERLELNKAIGVINKLRKDIVEGKRDPISSAAPASNKERHAVGLILSTYVLKCGITNTKSQDDLINLQILAGIRAKEEIPLWLKNEGVTASKMDIRGEVIGKKTLEVLEIIGRELLEKKNIKQIRRDIAAKFTFKMQSISDKLLIQLRNINIEDRYNNGIRYLDNDSKRVLWDIYKAMGLVDPNSKMNDDDMVYANRIIQVKAGIDNEGQYGELFGPRSKDITIQVATALKEGRDWRKEPIG